MSGNSTASGGQTAPGGNVIPGANAYAQRLAAMQNPQQYQASGFQTSAAPQSGLLGGSNPVAAGQAVASHPTNAAAWGFAPGYEQNATGNIIGMTGKEAFGGYGSPWWNENAGKGAGFDPRQVGDMGNRVLHRNIHQPQPVRPEVAAMDAANRAKQAYTDNYWANLQGQLSPTAYDALPLEQQSAQQLAGNQQYLQNQLNTYNANYGQAEGGVSNQQQQLMARLAQIAALQGK